jgi:acyl-ACP thioesterase
LFQEGALLQAEELGFGESHCILEGRMWVLSRLLLEIESFPAHRSRIELSTWPKKPQGPFANRDFLIRSEEGRLMARATSAWLLLDVKTLRPIRPQPLFEKFPVEGLGEALTGTAPKIPVPSAECGMELNVTARYSDLDQNRHVNNTRYVRWFLDCYGPEEIAPVEKLRFSINYLSAATFNDKVHLCRTDADGFSTIRGFLEDGSETFSARISLPE